LVREWLARQEEISPGIEGAKKQLQAVYQKLEQLFAVADPTLGPSVQAEFQKVSNGLDQLEKKGNAALKRKHEVALNQMKSVLEMVNPHQTPQERHENFLSFYAKHGNEIVKELMDHFHPFDFKMSIVTV
jgi:bacillithiol synthase